MIFLQMFDDLAISLPYSQFLIFPESTVVPWISGTILASWTNKRSKSSEYSPHKNYFAKEKSSTQDGKHGRYYINIFGEVYGYCLEVAKKKKNDGGGTSYPSTTDTRWKRQKG